MTDIAAPERLSADAPSKMLRGELDQEYEHRAARMAGLFAKGGVHYDLTEAEVGELRALGDELAALNKGLERFGELDQLRARAEAAAQETRAPGKGFVHPGAPHVDPRDGGSRTPADTKTLGDLFVASDGYKSTRGVSRRVFALETELDLKTVMTLTAGFAADPRRSPRVVYVPERRLFIADRMPSDPTTDNLIRYMEETTNTNNAAPVAEGGLKPEGALVYTERQVPVELIAELLPVTVQQLDDVPQIRGIIDNRLTYHLMVTEENQILNGTGTSPQLQGILTRPGIQTQAKGTDPTPTAIYLAMTKIRVNAQAEPDTVVVHPNDWAQIRTLQTTDGIYIWGPPHLEGPETIWGKTSIITTAIAEGTALVASFALYSHLSRRMGIRIDASTEHSDFFARNQVMLRAEERLAAEWYRPSAFCTVTGI